jgi:hypothetical protein
MGRWLARLNGATTEATKHTKPSDDGGEVSSVGFVGNRSELRDKNVAIDLVAARQHVRVANAESAFTDSAQGHQNDRWLICLRDRLTVELICVPSMTTEEVKRSYPDAVDVVPSTHKPEPPSAPLSESERQSVLAWLRSLGERDQCLIDATLEQCNSSAEARDYFLSKAGAGSA